MLETTTSAPKPIDPVHRFTVLPATDFLEIASLAMSEENNY
jgi:hypothetical protein